MSKARQKLLIVDDTPANIQILHQIFQSDYDIFFSTSGAGGIEVAMRELPDIILLDIMMPEMDGYETCRNLKSDPATASIPVIFVTAMGEEEDETKGLEAGAIDYITKPISPPIVKARVRNHLELKMGRDLLSELATELAAKNFTMEREKALAHTLLETILPGNLQVEGFSTAIYFKPSDQIGGDFFDGWREGKYAHFLVGDISGHSISAALLMAVCKGLFMTIGKGKTDPALIFTIVNRMLTGMLADSGMFLTIAYAVCDIEGSELQFASAGHNPAYLYSAGTMTALEATGPPLGWDAEDSWGVTRRRFLSGDRLLLYTDGLIEVRNKEGVLCSEDIFTGVSSANSPLTMVTTLLQAADSYCDGAFDDDVTLVAIGYGAEGEQV
jgi:sigma-B regulation protein RsbU (phosphoserine phosphatase)